MAVAPSPASLLVIAAALAASFLAGKHSEGQRKAESTAVADATPRGPASPAQEQALPSASAGGGPSIFRNVLGEHLLAEIAHASRDRLDDFQGIQRASRDACAAANLTVVDLVAHRFSPQGVSVVVVLAESHLSIHTWPELGYAAVDVYSCGNFGRGRGETAAKVLANFFESKGTNFTTLPRGIPNPEFLLQV